VYEALRVKVFPFPKIKRERGGRLVECFVHVSFTCILPVPKWTKPSILAGEPTRSTWLEYFCVRGFIDHNNGIN
jgi:hypothetical protein